jgi:alpha-L-fucosidase 2
MKLIARMLTPVTTTLTDYKDGGGMYKSLLCAHPPFQIDGNFGVTSGIAEMLLQSHEDFIHLLPALPATWRDGFVEGLCARGGLRVDMSWTEGRLENVRLVSMSGGPCRIRYNGQESEVSLQAKKSFEWRI